MKYPIPRLIFNRRKTASRNTTASVEIEITHGGKRIRFATGIKLYKGEWDNRRQCACCRDDIMTINNQLSHQVEQVQQTIITLMESDEEFTLDRLIYALHNKRSESFLEFVKQMMDTRNNVGIGTVNHHRSWYSIFCRQKFIKYFSDLTVQNIQKYDAWLRNRGIKQTTVWSHHKRLKVYIHHAIAMGLLSQDPYKGFKVSRGKPDEIRYLREEDVVRLRELELNQPFARVRDLFIIQCYTGMSYSDLMATDWKKVEPRDGHLCLRDQRKKTKETYYILLLAPVVEILDRYGYTLPHISNQKYNVYLKALQQIAGITTRLTTHVGRHTFATMMLNKKVPIDIVAKMLGHSTSKTTEIYAEVLGETVEQAYLMVEKKLK